MYSMFVAECFHNKCFKLSTLHSVYIRWGCESDMILSVMTKEWEEQLRLQWEGAEGDNGGKGEQNK